MNRIFAILLFLALVLPVSAQTVSTAGPGNPLPTAEVPFYQFIIPATQTQAITAGTAVAIPSAVPGGATCLWLIASGAVNVGNASVTTTVSGGINLSDGGYLKLPLRMDQRTLSLYVINSTAGATCAVRLMYSK